ncbi:MAG: hypothetical protein ACI3V3_04190 [Faecousia sp.]
MSNIYIDPIEAVELAFPEQMHSRDFSKQICRIFCARPIKSDAENFYRFVDTVFNAGRISGIRQERLRRSANKQQNATT